MMGPLTESWFFGGDDDMTSALETGFICIRFIYTSSANGKRRLLHHNSRNRPTRSKIPQRHSRASKGDSARLAKAIPQGKGRLGMALTLQRMCLYFVHISRKHFALLTLGWDSVSIGSLRQMRFETAWKIQRWHGGVTQSHLFALASLGQE